MIKLRKNRVVSDDEDEDEDEPAPKPRQKGKSRAAAIQSVLESQQEASLRAMMDMDDCKPRQPIARLVARPPHTASFYSASGERVCESPATESGGPRTGR